MKIKLSILFVSILFLFACSPSEDTASVQPTREPSDNNNVALEVEEESTPNTEPTPIPMSDTHENGRYFLTSHTTKDGVENVEYIRKGNESDAYGIMQIKCSDNQIRKNSTDNPEVLQSLDLGDWYTPTPDWTDKDIFNFICK